MEQHSKALFKLPRAELVKILKVHGIIGHSKLKKREIVQEMLRLCETPEGGALNRSIKKYTMKAHEAGKSMASGITSRTQALKGGALQDSFQTLGLNNLEPYELKHRLETQYIQPGAIEIDEKAVKGNIGDKIGQYTELIYRHPTGLKKIYIKNDHFSDLEKTLSSTPSSIQDDPLLGKHSLKTEVVGVNVYVQYGDINKIGNTVLLIGEHHDTYAKSETVVGGSRIVPFLSWLKKIDQEHKIYVLGEALKGIPATFKNYKDTDRRDDAFGKELMDDLHYSGNYDLIDAGFRKYVTNKRRNPDFLGAPAHVVYEELMKISLDWLKQYIDDFEIMNSASIPAIEMQSIIGKFEAYITDTLERYTLIERKQQIITGKTKAEIITPVLNKETKFKRLRALRHFCMMFCDLPSLCWMYEKIYKESTPINIVIVNGDFHTDSLYRNFFRKNYNGNQIVIGGKYFGTSVNMKGLRFV